MRYLNNRTDLEKSIISNAYSKITSEVKPIQIVPFPGGNQNPNDIKFKENILNNVCDNSENSDYKKCYIYDNNDNSLKYNHTGKYVASASSIMSKNDKKKDYYDAFNAFNNDGYGWRSASDKAVSTINVYKKNNNRLVVYEQDQILEKGTDYVEKYGRPHYGSSFFNDVTTKTTIEYGAIENGSATGITIDLSGSVDIYGEWLQIETPSPIYLYRYSIRVPKPDTGFEDGLNYLGNTYPSDKMITQNYINSNEGFGTKTENGITITDSKPDITITNTKLDTLQSIFSYSLSPSITVKTPNDRLTSHFPKVFTVVGSNDGNKWYYIDQQSFVDPPDLPYKYLTGNSYTKGNSYIKGYGYEKDDSQNIVTFQVNSVDRYRYFRLIISEMFPNNSYVHITNWTLSAFVDNFTPNKDSKKESFSNFRENSPGYVTGMTNWEYFSDDIDTTLLNKQKEQKEMVSQARNDKNPLSNLEPFTQNYPKEQQFLNEIKANYTGYNNSQRKINDNYYVMGNSIASINMLYGNVINADGDVYDFKSNGFSKDPMKIDGWINDNKEIVMQQNSMYVLSTITIASLVLALILVSK